MKLPVARFILVVFVLPFALLAIVETGVAGGKAKNRVIVVSGTERQRRIGSFYYEREDAHPGGDYAAATRAFGAPTAKKVNLGYCELRWRSLGLEIELLPFGSNPCSVSSLKMSKLSESRVISPIWRTDRGLRVGDSKSRLQGLYPEAKHGSRRAPFSPREWWTLATKKGHILLVANVKAGRVNSFEVSPAH
jgi:hypothetical protein